MVGIFMVKLAFAKQRLGALRLVADTGKNILIFSAVTRRWSFSQMYMCKGGGGRPWIQLVLKEWQDGEMRKGSTERQSPVASDPCISLSIIGWLCHIRSWCLFVYKMVLNDTVPSQRTIKLSVLVNEPIKYSNITTLLTLVPFWRYYKHTVDKIQLSPLQEAVKAIVCYAVSMVI